MPWAVHAQTQPEIQITTSEADLEAEYRDELDKWMLRAYEGDADAQFKVGVLFTNDQFGPPDYEQAVYWYTQSARQGHVLAQYNLGHQYLTGVGVAKSEESAMRWWLRAAEQDHALAQFNVGRAYYLGIGLNEDHIQSKYWFERAAANQEPKSIDILKQLGWYDGSVIADASGSEMTTSAGPVNAEGTTSSNPGLTSKIVPIAAEDLPAPRPQTSTVANESAVNEVVAQANTSPSTTPAPSSNAGASNSSAPSATTETSNASTPDTDVVRKNPLALYTNPAVRSVLIAILDEREGVNELARDGEWATVQSEYGFPVWVHGDFLTVDGSQGKITGQAVNARSVPIITNGTVVGRLNKDEEVNVIDQRKSWYRITAPKRFKAWVKTDELDREPIIISTERSAEPAEVAAATPQTKTQPQSQIQPQPQVAAPQNNPAPVASSSTANTSAGSRPINDNEWLFNQPSENYTLQLASFDDPLKIQEFENRAKFIDNPELHRFTATGKNIEWTYFLYGSYSNRESAESAKLEIKQKRAWVRTFGRLQQNRCVAWKTKLPTPSELNRYCTQ